MKKNIICLGIETSCDETSVAIVDSNKNIISNIVYSQIPEHQKYGGVVPELAARSHILTIDKITDKAIKESKLSFQDIDIIAGVAGPGLIGGVIIGWLFASGLAKSLNKPLIAVNHLEGHALTPRLAPADSKGKLLEYDLNFPYLLLLASGGHCQILLVFGVGKYEIIGETVDDTAGEVFDKIARMLNLGYPGGPEIDRLSKKGNKYSYKLPRPLCEINNSNFSFSGIKSMARNIILKEQDKTNKEFIYNMAASTQFAITECIINRLKNALDNIKVKINAIVVSGGVAKNTDIREKIELLSKDYNIPFIAPPLNLCTDNGAMIAWAGIENYNIGNMTTKPISPRPRWPLTEL